MHRRTELQDPWGPSTSVVRLDIYSLASGGKKKSMGVVGSMILGVLLGGGLIDSLNAAAPLVASTALIAIAAI